jgi:hypothetical protein
MRAALQSGHEQGKLLALFAEFKRISCTLFIRFPLLAKESAALFRHKASP